MFLQIDLPEELSRKLTILKGQLNLHNKQEVIIHILKNYKFKEDNTDKKNG